jgi:hypothetical protein
VATFNTHNNSYNSTSLNNTTRSTNNTSNNPIVGLHLKEDSLKNNKIILEDEDSQIIQGRPSRPSYETQQQYQNLALVNENNFIRPHSQTQGEEMVKVGKQYIKKNINGTNNNGPSFPLNKNLQVQGNLLQNNNMNSSMNRSFNNKNGNGNNSMISIHSKNNENPQHVVEYIKEIFEHLRETEVNLL